MSLWRWKGRIMRAVAGELSVDEEQRLRGHLAGCPACRGFYDELAATSEALAPPDGGGSRRAALREEQRLRLALAPHPAGRPKPRVAWGLWAIPAAAAVLVVMKVFPRPASEPPDHPPGVAWRGAGTPEPLRRDESVLLFASRNLGPGRHGPVRMVGEIPGSGESAVTSEDFLQLAVRNLQRPTWPWVLARAEGANARPRVLWPVGAGNRIEPGAKENVPVGPSIDVGASGLAGKVTLCVLLLATPPPETTAWPRGCDEPEALRGLLVIAPAP